MSSVPDLPEEVRNLSEEERDERKEELLESVGEAAADLTDREQDAVDALIGDATETADTAVVELESGLQLDVRTRIPPQVEEMQDKLERLEHRNAPLDAVRRVNCEMVAEMVVTDGYDSPDSWLIASRDGNAGLQWLSEATATVLEPAIDRAEETKGKFER